MGSGVQIVEETRFDMSDGIYRVVRVIRDNAKLTIQVDSEEPKEYVSRGKFRFSLANETNKLGSFWSMFGRNRKKQLSVNFYPV